MLRRLILISSYREPYRQITSGIPDFAHTRTRTHPGTSAGDCVCLLLYFSTKRDASLYLYKYSQIRRLPRPFDLRGRC